MLKKYNFCILFFLLGFLMFNGTLFSQEWVLAGSVTNPGVQPTISVVDWNTVWIADGFPSSPKVFRTINGGLSWGSILTSGISQELYCLYASSDNVAIVGEGEVNGGARLFMTTNTGQSWNVLVQTNPNQGYFNGLAFPRLDISLGLAVAERIYRSVDGGYTWTMVQSGVNGVSNAQNSLMIIDNSFYGFGLNNGAPRIRLTTNNGIGWLNQAVNIAGSVTSAIAFKENKLYGVVATTTSLPIIGRTTDGGNTWNDINVGSGVTGECKIKWVLGTPVVYLMGANGGIKRSLDNGVSWSSMQVANVTDLKHFDFVYMNGIIFGYAVSSNGTVIKLADSVLLITGNNNNKSNIPTQYSLEQNYPNPFNPTTTINFGLPKAESVTLKIYDILGREIETIVNDNLKAGNYSYSWNADNYSSGVYFYTLNAGNNFTQTKKMILEK